MYEELNCFEEAPKHFGTRVDVLIAMEMSLKLTADKKRRKKFNQTEECLWK